MDGSDDLSRLSVLNERTVLQHLKDRYLKDVYYTFLGDVLVAINPNKTLPIYGSKHHEKYSLENTEEKGVPHIFWITQQSFKQVLSSRKNQCVLVSGESGTGKTESTKLFIDHVSYLCNTKTDSLHEKITRVNPLLESFGNAVTPMNSNSSRFGKLIELQISENGHLCGAKIQDYLLEKSRVVSQGSGERNFHIFYCMFAGLSKEQRIYYNLGSVGDYRILQHGRVPAFSRKSFTEMKSKFADLLDLMKTVGFTEDDIATVLTVLSGILHLTNITFVQVTDDSDSVIVQETETLEAASSLLGVKSSVLQDTLVSNTMNIRGENVRTMKKQHQADDGRDALAKTLYSRLFGWIVGQINVHLQEEGTHYEDVQTLSILDFSGFERLQRNCFDQLCINAANERLHQYLCHHIFALEHSDLTAQGVDADLVEFKDNQPLIDLLFKKPQGLFYLIDEESSFPQATDRSLVAKLDAMCANSEQYLPARGNPDAFTVVHYAGQVVYDARGMLERNRDSLGSNIEDVMLDSASDMIRLLFVTREHATGSYSRSFSAYKMRPQLYSIPKQGEHNSGTNTRLSGSKYTEMSKRLSGNGNNKSYVSRYFRKSLGELVQKLENSEPWFIRCVRPNSKSVAGVFEDHLVMSQLQYNGLLEIAKIRRDGFPARMAFQDFVEKYRDISFNRQRQLAGDRKEAEDILRACQFTGYALGHSKVFLHLLQSREIDKKLNDRRKAIRRQEEEEERMKKEEEEKKRKAEEEEIARRNQKERREKEIEILEEVKMRQPKDALRQATFQQGHKKSVGFSQSEDKSVTSSAHQKVKDWIEMNEDSLHATPPTTPLNEEESPFVSINVPDGIIDSSQTEHNSYESTILDSKQWDKFQVVPRDGHQDHASTRTGIKMFKVGCYILILGIVLSAAVLNKLSLLTLSSGILKMQETANDPRPTMLLIVICFPYVCNTFVYLSRSLFGNTGWPSFRMIFAMLSIELCHTIGLCLLVFRVLPRVDMMRALIVMSTVYSGPSIMMTLSAVRNAFGGSWSTVIRSFTGVFCIGVQVTSVVVCCYDKFILSHNDKLDLLGQTHTSDVGSLVYRREPEKSEFLWELPLSLVMISLSFWENFIDGDIKYYGFSMPFSVWKKNIHLVRQRLYVFLSLWKIAWSILLAVLLVDGFSFSLTFTHGPDDAKMSQANIHLARFGPLYCCMGASILCTYFSSLACKLNMQRISFALPLCLVTPLSLGVVFLRCRLKVFNIQEDCYFWICPESWSNELPYHFALFGAVWLSQCLLLSHIWQTNSERMAKIEKLFITPLRCSVLTEQTLMMRRRTPSNEKTLQKGLEENRFYHRSTDGTVPQIYACATMWHETRTEMTKLLKSIFRMDIDHSARAIAQKYYKIKDPDYYEFEAHIFFDDAFEMSDDDRVDPNFFVIRLIECLDEAVSSVHERPTTMSPPERTPTSYGGRLTWTLPGGTNLVVHLKDKQKIRNRKRWSQVMYLYYLLGYKLLANDENLLYDEEGKSDIRGPATDSKIRLTAAQLRKRRRSAFFSRTVIFNHVSEDIQRKANNTYLLTLDGDVDFRPEAVRLLVDRMRKNKKVGAACGRIHPIGSGPIVWYQQFEYAIGHWLQKATEHVFGCVLCAPGCFSLFRGSALMDDNVAKMYATKSTEAGHFVQFDQGEDRWLSTLLLQQGYRIDYSAAADAFTQAPETFNEFFNQRRRWGPSTLANILDLLGDWRSVVHINDNISSLYIFYQTMMFVSTLLGPATVLLMMAGAYQVVFKITVFESFFLAIIPALGFVLFCMFAKPDTQLSVAAVLSAVYAIVMTVVLVGTIGTAISGSITSPNVIFMVMLSLIFIISGFMHPRELGCLVPGVLYFICIPAGYLVLTIYFLTNLHVVSWGTREVPKKKTKEELKKEEEKAKEKQKRKEEKKSGIFGMLGIRYILTEVGELMKQFRTLLFETGQRQEPKDTSRSKKTMKRSNSTHDTNDLLKQLIEELKVTRGIGQHTKRSDTESDPEEMETKEAGGRAEIPAKGLKEVVVVPSLVAAPNLNIREDPARPQWILHPSIGQGPIKLLGERERVFWNQLLAKYLNPIVDEPQERERIHKDLLALRNNVVFAFFMTSAVWMALFMQLEILQAELKDYLFVHIPRIDGDGMVSFQPLGLFFLGCFSLVLLLQFMGMFSHRWGTILHTLSITDIGIGGHFREQDKVKDIILRVSELQKLRNIEMEPEPDYDEPLPDYLEEEEQSSSTSSVDKVDPNSQHEIQGVHGIYEHPSTTRPFGIPVNHDGQQIGHNGPPSVPPSYHTQEMNALGAGPSLHDQRRRHSVFDRHGTPYAFALENAFERRFRNKVQGQKYGNQDQNMYDMSQHQRYPTQELEQQSAPQRYANNYSVNSLQPNGMFGSSGDNIRPVYRF